MLSATVHMSAFEGFFAKSCSSTEVNQLSPSEMAFSARGQIALLENPNLSRYFISFNKLLY